MFGREGYKYQLLLEEESLYWKMQLGRNWNYLHWDKIFISYIKESEAKLKLFY